MGETYLTRETLLRRLRSADDDQAWEEFVFFYRKFIFSVIVKMGVREADCDDLSQKVLLKLWESLPNFNYNEKRGFFRNWLYTITRNTVVTYINRVKMISNKKSQIQNDMIEQFESPEIDKMVKEEWEKHIAALAFTNIKKKVSEQALDAFQSSLRKEPVAETAQRLGLEENTVYIYKNRVKKKFIEEIKNLREMLE